MSAGRLFQIAEAAHRKAREPVTVLVRVAHSKLELELRRVREGLYIIKTGNWESQLKASCRLIARV